MLSCHPCGYEKPRLIKRSPAPIIRHLLACHRRNELSALETARELGLARTRFYEIYADYTHSPDAFTQLGQALHFYGVKLRYAPTPQAKGKSERRHDYWQKRCRHFSRPITSTNSKPPTGCSTNS